MVRKNGSDYEVIDIHGNIVFIVPKGSRTKKEHEIITDYLAELWEGEGCFYDKVQHLLFDSESYVSPYQSRRSYEHDRRLNKDFGHTPAVSPYPQHYRKRAAL